MGRAVLKCSPMTNDDQMCKNQDHLNSENLNKWKLKDDIFQVYYANAQDLEEDFGRCFHKSLGITTQNAGQT